MSHPPMIYGLTSTGGEADAITFEGAATRLPGATACSAGVLFNTIALGSEELAFGNHADITTGWSIGVGQSAADPRVILATLSFGVVGGTTDVVTVPIGACSNEWLFLAFTVDDTTLTVHVNGEVAYTATLNGAIIPSVGTPTLEVESLAPDTLVAWAFYTESALTAALVAFISAQLKKNAGTVDWTSAGGVVLLQHVYSATESMRPVAADVWADTGSTPTASLTRTEGTIQARVLPGDFSQAVIGAIVDPDGPVPAVL